MGMRLDVKRKSLLRSDRVKCVDFHPTEPWVLVSLYTGCLHIYNYETKQTIKTFEISEVPLRAAKFIARKNWIITGSDDMQIRVINFNTHEKVVSFEAHPDYIRCLAVHPTQPLVISGSDDMTIRLWNWEKGWKNVQTFEGHSHFVMHVAFNPKDSNTFASASLDKTIKIWSLGSDVPNFTLEGHEKGVNYVDYYQGVDKPYLISAADDNSVKVWDYQNKNCVQTLEGHSNNVNFAAFHPTLPIILSGSEDGTVRIWASDTYSLQTTLNYGLERAWCLAYQKDGNKVALGFDDGSIVIELGSERPVISMDTSGKIVWARQKDIQTANVKAGAGAELKDGERLKLSVKDLSSCEVYPQTLKHSPNNRFVVVCGDGEYIIYTALAWRNQSFGSGLDFVWASDPTMYAVRESTSRVKIFKNFKERPDVLPRFNYAAEGIFGGKLLGVRSDDFLNFYDWNTGSIIRRIDVNATNVYWSNEGDLVAITSPDSFYILRYNAEAYTDYLESGQPVGEEGVEEAFEVIADVDESVKTGIWANDCFLYTNSIKRLNYLVGNETFTISHNDKELFLLGYSPKDSRIYLADKDVNICSYVLSLSVVEYQTAILRGDIEAANSLMPSIPDDQRNRIARFLETQDLKELALEVSNDLEQKFDIALQLDKLNKAAEIAREIDSESKWRMLGDRALAEWKFVLAEECLQKSKDLGGLLLFYTANGNSEQLRQVADMAVEKGQNNIAFTAYFEIGAIDECIELLKKTDRTAEVDMFIKSYAPERALASE